MHWQNEYLLELREAHHHNKGTDVEIGDVVVVHSENHPRGFWKLAQVEQTITGHDGKILQYVSQGTVKYNAPSNTMSLSTGNQAREGN